MQVDVDYESHSRPIYKVALEPPNSSQSAKRSQSFQPPMADFHTVAEDKSAEFPVDEKKITQMMLGLVFVLSFLLLWLIFFRS